jgi:hypothetical protein
MKTFSKALFCLMVAIILSGTLPSYGQFALGLRIGYNGNALTTNLDSIKSQFNNGFHVGIWSRIGKRVYFAPEILYTLSGGVFTNEGNVSTTGWKQKINIGSLDVPLLVGFKIIHSKLITWRLEVGPEMSFVVGEKIKDVNSVTGPITSADISKANWYILAGTGIDVLFMSLDIRYQYGLNQMIQDVTQGTSTYSFDTKNSLIAVSLGFKLFGKK